METKGECPAPFVSRGSSYYVSPDALEHDLIALCWLASYWNHIAAPECAERAAAFVHAAQRVNAELRGKVPIH